MATRGDADLEAAALAQLADPTAARASLYATINTRRARAAAVGPSAAAARLLNCHAPAAGCRRRPGEVAGGHAATDVLIRAGYRRIGYINGEASMEAARHACAATARRSPPPPALRSRLVRDGQLAAAVRLRGDAHVHALCRSPPTAIFCANDLMAVGRYEALRELGLEDPRGRRRDGLRRPRDRRGPGSAADDRAPPHFDLGLIAAVWVIEKAAGGGASPRRIKVDCPIVVRKSV